MSMTRAEAVEASISLEEFERLPEEPGYRVELVRGRTVREPRPSAEHTWLASELFWRIESHAREHGLGRTLFDAGFLLEDDPPTIRIPDIAFLAQPGSMEERPEGLWTVAPDLAVEIVSRLNTASEIQGKVLEYLASGTRLVWVVEPATRSVTSYRSRKDVEVLTEGDDLDDGDVLPGFLLRIVDLFASWP
jgi:Uma2 family endonuclease